MSLLLPLKLFIILFLHQTTTQPDSLSHRTQLFIILFLHQTTTIKPAVQVMYGCLSSCSYIKPQLVVVIYEAEMVVYHLVPTSNHNAYTIILL